MTILVFHACRKIDTAVSLNKELTDKFFQTKGTINPSVQKVIDKIKKDNEKYHQVNSLANKEGLAIWDKAIVSAKTKSKSNAQQRTADGDNSSEIVIIPMVLEETEYVNSFLAAKITDTIEIKLFSGKDYDEYPFGDTITQGMTAERLASRIMFLDKEVFGYTKFKITDNRLFVKSPRTQNPEGTFSRLTADYTFGCWPVEIWIDPDGDADPCDCSGNEYFDHYDYNNWEGPDCNTNSGGGFGMGFGFTGGGGGGSSGGNNGYTGGGSNGSGNNGFTPIEEPDTPCDPSIADFENDAKFAAKFKELNSNAVTTQTYEKGYMVNDRAANSYIPKQGQSASGGASGTGEIEWTINSPIDGLLHSHYSGGNSIFSPQDLLFMAQIYLAGLAKDSTNLFFGMTSKDGDPYLIKVSNTALFRKFAEKYASTPEKQQQFINKYDNAFTKGFRSPDASTNESRFMQMLKNEIGEGAKMYRATDSNCNKWEKLSVDNFGSVNGKPCF